MPARDDAPDMVRVWELPLRLYHWALALFILLAWFTPSGYHGLHRFAGYTVAGLIVFRVVWGFFGTRFSRFHGIGRRLRAAPGYLYDLRHGTTGRYRGLDTAGTAMLVTLLILLAISTLTGWMSTTEKFFGVWWVDDTHAFVSDAIIVVVVVHVLGVIAMSVLQKENLVRAMFSGLKAPPPLIRSAEGTI